MNFRGYKRGFYMVVTVLTISLFVSSCVSMKSYRKAKAQMLWGEVELAARQSTIDSLMRVNATLSKEKADFDSKLAKKDSELREVKSQKSRLEVENALMRSELDMSEKK